MCLSRVSLRFRTGLFVLCIMTLSGCAVGPNESGERGIHFWNLAAIFSSPKDEVTPVDDPSLDETGPHQNAATTKNSQGTWRDIPILGPLLAALFSGPTTPVAQNQPTNLPEDEELAVDANAPSSARQSNQRQNFRVPVRLTRQIDEKPLLDRDAPILRVFHVNNGRLQVFSSTVTIRGIAEDASGLASLKLNGRPIRMRSRIFATKIKVPYGVHQALVEAEDTAGNVAYFQFKLVRKTARQNVKRNRPSLPTREIRPVAKPAPPPRLANMRDPGVYMVLMAGSTAAHIVKMPNLKKCREAVEFSNNAACTYHAGTTSPG